MINNGSKTQITASTDDDGEDTTDVPNTETDLEKIKSVLPFWPRLYCKLSNDNDRRVREYAHKAHLQSKYKFHRQIKDLAGPIPTFIKFQSCYGMLNLLI